MSAAPPLRAFIGGPGKSLFGRMHEPRIQTYRADFVGEVDPEIVVLPCSQPLKFDPSAISLPPRALQRLRDGSAALVFDGSLEGVPHDPAWTDALHGLLRRLGVAAERAAYLTQDRGYRQAYASHLASTGDGPAMHVLNYDYWIKRFFAGYEADGEAIFEQRLQAFHRRPGRRTKRFVSLNWTPRPSKMLFLLSLLRDDLWSRGHISFGGFESLAEHKDRTRASVRRILRGGPFAELIEPMGAELEALEGLGRVALDAPADMTPAAELRSGDAPLPGYQDAWFSAATESEMLDRPSRITEKPFKPLVNFHPILLLGNPGSLPLLRQLGFETFDGGFDEAYDEEADPIARFEMVYRQLVRLCAIDEGEVARLHAAMAERIIFNARWGLTKLPGVLRTQVDRAFVDQLLDAVG